MTRPVPPNPWIILFALIGAFALSQAFRTIAGVMAPPLQADLALSAAQLGWFAAMFHLVFGAMQLFMGVGIDLYGVRRMMFWTFPLVVLGAFVSGWAPSYSVLLLGQALIGVGCAPAFVSCTVFIAGHFPVQRFAAVSGITLGLGSLGMLLTASPLAWLIEDGNWRSGFLVLGVLSVLAWVAVALGLRGLPAQGNSGDSPGQAMLGFARLFVTPHTWGIFLLGIMVYASIMALRGLWLGPMLVDREGLPLVFSGDVALWMSVLMLLGAPLLGRLDPGDRWRRPALVGCTVVLAALFLVLAWVPGVPVAVVATLLVGALSSYTVWQYADVRASYPSHLLGRAIGVFTMSMFLGVALMQSLTGWVADLALARGAEPFAAVFTTIAVLLLAGAAAFALLPRSPLLRKPAQ